MKNALNAKRKLILWNLTTMMGCVKNVGTRMSMASNIKRAIYRLSRSEDLSIYLSGHEKRRIKRASTVLFYRFPLTRIIIRNFKFHCR